MRRRKFVASCTLATAGLMAGRTAVFSSQDGGMTPFSGSENGLFSLFRNPGPQFHPFVRWWWNGNKIRAEELVRELHLLRDAGVGGVEINPVQFPGRYIGDDLGIPSLEWLSNEWIDMLEVTFKEAKSLGMTCDLIVGSGWPWGAEYLTGEELSQVVVIGVRKITGPAVLDVSMEEIFREADPAINSAYAGKTKHLLSLQLVPDPLKDLQEVTILSVSPGQEFITVRVPEGSHALYSLVKVSGFMQVINGTPGATGPVLNHFNSDAVQRYLQRMSDTIEKRIGPLSGHLRAMFTDSLELEGANWCDDMSDEFRKRRGYDLLPFLPFVLFRTGDMGNIKDFGYGASMAPAIEDTIRRVRYDFELTKAELLDERYMGTFKKWCRNLGVKSRAQAYGKGLFPLESSLDIDIPECESWTMNWLKHKVGEEMPENDYRRGRAYTMINKYVSSAAHLKGKRLISCEEMTDTYTVFNTSLENLKIGGDQGAITGVTHSVLHGFNYSPPEAPYPGWIRYGCYYSEHNTWWPYFHLFNEYRGRLSALFRHADMSADIAILPPLGDMWSRIGTQTEPFPAITHADYFTLVWEAITKNGSGSDYITERVLKDAATEEGYLRYGPRKYSTLFLVQADSINTETARKLLDFVTSGGKIICIESYPSKSTGWHNHEENDSIVSAIVEKMKLFPDRFILVKRPEKDFIAWYREIQERYGIKPYVRIDNPGPYLMQCRYQADDGSEYIYFINSHLHNSYTTRITFAHHITRKKYCWIWNPLTGNRSRVQLHADNSMILDLGPADSLLFVFDSNRSGPAYRPLPADGDERSEIKNGWSAEFRHCHNGSVTTVPMDVLKDIRDMPGYVNFSGIVIYRNRIRIKDKKGIFINLGKVWGVSEVWINGRDAGTGWHGRRIISAEECLDTGENEIEIRVATSMGNYMKSLADNPIAQYWTNEKNKVQPLQSMGLLGPVTIYRKRV